MPDSSKTDFLDRVICMGSSRGRVDPLRTDDEYVRDNVRITAQALQLGLVRLVRPTDGIGYELRITPAGRLLRQGALEEAAAALHAGSTPTRISGPEPSGLLASRLRPGIHPISLDNLVARTYAPELLRCIATGYARVFGDVVRHNDPLARAPVPSPAPSRTIGDRHLLATLGRAAG